MRTASRSAERATKYIVGQVPVERRLFVGDRRATWRGSRRDVDWIKHFEDETLERRRSADVAQTLLPES